jgi:hypothetical protein
MTHSFKTFNKIEKLSFELANSNCMPSLMRQKTSCLVKLFLYDVIVRTEPVTVRDLQQSSQVQPRLLLLLLRSSSSAGQGSVLLHFYLFK